MGSREPLDASDDRGRLFVLAVIEMALLLWGLAVPDAVGGDLRLALVGAGVLLLEAGAVPLPRGGFFSAAAACYLAAGLLPGLGFKVTSLLVMSGVLVLVARSSGASVPERVRRAVVGGLPALLSIAAAHLVASHRPELGPWVPLMALLVYLPLALFIPVITATPLECSPDGTASSLPYSDLWPYTIATGFAGLILAQLMQAVTWYGLLVVPGLLGLHVAARERVSREDARDRAALEVRARRLETELSVGAARYDRARKDLDRRLEENLMLADLGRTLLLEEDVHEVLRKVVDKALRLVPSSSVAIFLHHDGRLVPMHFVSSHAERLRMAPLLDVVEPVVEAAWRLGSPEVARAAHLAGARLFEGEAKAAAFPMESVGVLYVGSRLESGEEADSFSENEMQLMALLATQAAFAIQSTMRRQAQQEALAMYSEANAQLEQWVYLLRCIVDASRVLASTLDPEVLLDGLEAQLDNLVRHSWHLVVLGQASGIRAAGHDMDCGLQRERTPGPRLCPLESCEFMAVVQANRSPLLIDDIQTSRFPPPWPDLRSLLVVPMLTEEGPVGAIALGAPDLGAFSREQQDVLFIVAYQVGATLRKARLHQELVVAHRELAESQAQLIQSSKLAAVGQLAAGVAHEINSPLGAVLIAIEAAQMKLPARPEVAIGKLEAALKAAVRAREIIKKLLWYSREARSERRAVDVNELLRDIFEFLGSQLSHDGIEMTCQAGAVPTVMGNQNELQQVVINLLLNARDAVLSDQARGRRVDVVTRAEEQAVVLEVRDEGPGIAPDIQARIFDPFFTTKPVGKGTGLGLSVSQQIVGQHGGTLSVSSQEGGPTVFTLRLPAMDESVGAPDRVTPVPPISAREGP